MDRTFNTFCVKCQRKAIVKDGITFHVDNPNADHKAVAPNTVNAAVRQTFDARAYTI